MGMNNRDMAELVQATVAQAEAQSKLRMGRNYASGYEVWAMLRRQLEDIQQDVKNVAKLHGEMWSAVKDDNLDEVMAEMSCISSSASVLCAALAALAAEAQRAVEEL